MVRLLFFRNAKGLANSQQMLHKWTENECYNICPNFTSVCIESLVTDHKLPYGGYFLQGLSFCGFCGSCYPQKITEWLE